MVALTEVAVKAMNLEQLKSACEERKLTATGPKNRLIKNLLETIQDKDQEDPAPKPKKAKVTKAAPTPLEELNTDNFDPSVKAMIAARLAKRAKKEQKKELMKKTMAAYWSRSTED